MIAKTTAIVNAALRARWSTVTILALILTMNRAFLDAPLWSIDAVAYTTKLFLTLILSFIISLAVHVALYLIFSPKHEHPEVPTLKFAPGVVHRERSAPRTTTASAARKKKK